MPIYILWAEVEVARNSLKWSKSYLTSLTLDPYFTDHTIVTIASTSWLSDRLSLLSFKCFVSDKKKKNIPEP